MDSKQYIAASLEELPNIVGQLMNDVKHPIVLLVGELGAGKTTLVKEILRLQQCSDIGSSPSYSIINQYNGKHGIIYHIDLYRIEHAEEAFALGLEEILYSGSPCYIEWPQIIMDYLNVDHHTLTIEVDENNHRHFRLE